MEQLAKLKTPFRNHGTVTAGNASGVNDGAARIDRRLGSGGEGSTNLTPRARVLGMAAAAVPPRIMGIGPVPATRKLMERLGHKIGDYDLIEINEAFASQSLACLRQFGLSDDAEHVNPHGGAIALGHPLGMSGARLVLTAAHGLHERGGKLALATMCVGVGQGVVARDGTRRLNRRGRAMSLGFSEREPGRLPQASDAGLPQHGQALAVASR